MAKQLNVNLNFTADTSAAEANLASLKSELASIASMGAGKSPALVGPELQKAIVSAKELNKHLSGAFNPKTGNLNLTAFQQSLTKSNQSLSTLSQNLLGAGKAGQTAFMNLQNGIAAANIQLNKAQTLLGTFATTFMNTLRWQATSSIIHGVSGAISEAMGYAKDLNKTLTDIRIVAPEKSMEDMAKFAKIANKQAKEFSSTTLDYAKGALIYYQQGLEDADVRARTDVTTKMANVTGDSTDEVSSYMTAIWNNFNKAGDESEEHFADILTKLGAETAANTTEITTALEKYTGVANTIGLSYESATAAATTLIDRMRETPEVAGTALKTIFARLEGLKLEGSTDEGGLTTDLNKYSTALHQIGVEIKDANGEIRAADDILIDIGKKWNSGELTQDVKIATAETVAGIRQWQQFAALMDNFDFFEKYKDMAEFGSEGALQEQQDIYAESWEAASNRVKTAWQDIYAQVFDDKVFIKITDAFAKIIESVDTTIKTMGGLRGIILLISSLLLSKFSANVTLGLEKGITTLTTKFGQFNAAVRSVFSGKFLTNLTTANKAIKDGTSLLNQESQAVLRIVQANQALPQSFRTQASQLERINTMTNQIASMGGLISKGQREQLQNELNFVQTLAKEEALANEAVEVQQRKVDIIQSEINGLAIVAGRHQEISNMLEEEGLASEKLIESVIKQESMSEAMKQTSTIMQELISLQEEFLSLQAQGLGDAEKITELFTNRLNLLKEEGGLHATIAEEILASYEETTNYNDSLTISIDLLEKVVNALTQSKGSGEQLSQGMRNLAQDSNKAAIATEKVENALTGTSNALANIGSKGFSTLGQIPKMISGLSSAALSISMIGSAIKTLGDKDASVMDKFVSSTMALAFAMGTIQTVAQGVREAFTAYQVSLEGLTAAQVASEAISAGMIDVAIAEAGAKTVLSAATGVAAGETTKDTIAKMANAIQTRLNVDSELALAMAEKVHEMSAKGMTKTEMQKVLAGMLAEKQLDKETIATLRAAIANQMFGKSFVGLLLPILGVVAALALAAAAIYAVHKNAHLAEQRFEDLRSQTNQVKEGYNDLVDTTNEIHSSMESWKEHQDTLKDLTYGTQEWRQALREVNEEAKTTIKSFNEANDGLQDLDSKNNGKYLKELNRQEEQAGYDKSTTLDLEEGKDYYTDQYGERILTEAGSFKIEAVNEMSVNAAQVSLNSAQMVQNRAEENQYLTAFDKKWDGKISGTSNTTGFFMGLHGSEAQDYESLDPSDYAKQAYTGMRQDQEFTKDSLADKNWLLKAGFDKDSAKDIINNEEFRNDLFDILTQMKQNQAEEIENTKASLLDDAAVQDAIFGKNSPLSDKEKEEYGGSIQNQMSSDINVLSKQWAESETKMQQLKAAHGEDYWNQSYADQNNLNYNAETGEFSKVGPSGEEEVVEVDQQEIDNLIAYTAAYEDRTAAMQHYFDLVKDSQQDWAAKKEIADSEEWKALDQAITDATNGVEGADKQVKEYAKNLAGTYSKQLAQFLDIDEEKAGSIFDEKFIEDHKEDFQKAMHDDEEAIEDLQHAAAKEMVLDIKDNDLQDLIDNADDFAIEGLGINYDSLSDDLDAINEYIGSQEFDDLEVGTEIDDTGFIEGLNHLMALGDEGVAQAESIMAAAGVEPEIGYKVVDLESGENVSDASGVQKTIHGSIPSATLNADGTTTVSEEDYTAFINTDQKSKADSGMEGYTIVPFIKSMKKGPSQMSPSAPPNKANTRAPSGGGGGGGGGGRRGGRRARAARHEVRENKIDRYHDVTKNIEKIKRAQEKTNEITDKLYGAKRINNMEKVNKKLKEELKAIQAKNKLTNTYIALERERLAEELKYYQGKTKKDKDGVKWGKITDVLQGQSFKFDEFGNITNYNEIMNKLQAKRDAYVKELNKQKNEEKQKDYKEKWIDPLDEIIDHLQGFVDAYEEELQTLLDQIDAWSDAYNEILENNFEMANYEIEFRVEVNDYSKKLIDYYTSKLEDDIYKISELYNKLFVDENSSLANIMQKTEIYTDKIYKDAFGQSEAMEAYDDHYRKLYQSGQITQADYVEALKNEYDALLENASALNDLKKEMDDYYDNVLNEVMDKLNNYIDRIYYTTEALEHLMNVMDLSVNGKDYNNLINLQDKIVKQAERKYLNSLHLYQELLRDYENAKANLEATPLDDEEAIKKREDELNDYLNRLQEMGSTVMSDYEDMLNAAHQLLETKLELAAKDIEAVIAGVEGGFEELTRQMNLSSTRQDEYLTKTNQVYEMNKLLRSLRADIDKTDNKAAKQRLGNFAKELENLKEKDELSQLELDIAEARYKQLQAQIALEEAQNAKSTVRLMRDNEGNYGYVYTANEDKVSDAQQALDDATNELYNILLEAENDYNQKIINYAQEMLNAIKEVEENTDLSDAEKQDRINRIRDQYGKLIDDAKGLLDIANDGLTKEFNAYSEAWSNEYTDNVNTVLNNLDNGVDNWLGQIELIKKEYTDLSQKYQEAMDGLVDTAIAIGNQGQEEFDTALNKFFGPGGTMETAFNNLVTWLTSDVNGLPGINKTLLSLEGTLDNLYAKIFAEAYNKGAEGTFYNYNKLLKYVQDYNEAGSMEYKDNGALNFTNSAYNFKSENATAEDEKKAAEIWSNIELGARGWIGLDDKGHLAYVLNENGRKDDKAYENAKAKLTTPLLKFASGGYTGAWGSEEGKVAMLHEKELVLNQKDTENMLAAVDIVRNIVEMIDMNILSTAANISAVGVNAPDRELDQNVTITAEFPNATDRNEIEAAFDNLVNRAAQYANRF